MRIIIFLLLLPLMYTAINYEAATNILVDYQIETAVATDGPEKLEVEDLVGAATINKDYSASKNPEAIENLETEVIISEIIGSDFRGYEALIKNPKSIVVTDQMESTLSAYERNRAIIAINGGGFIGREPIGNTVINGDLKGSFKPTNHNWDIFIGFDRKNKLIGGRVDNYRSLSKMDPVYGVSFGPALVVEGEPQHTTSTDLHPRTAVGQLDCGSLLFIVIDGRQPGWSRGITVNDLRDLFIERGAVNAYNLDGGGSSAMIFEGRILNRPSDGRLRLVANNIIVL